MSSVTLDSANLSIVRKHDGFFNLEFGAENIAGADYFDASSLLERLDEFFNSAEMERFQDLNLFGLTAQLEDQRTDKRYTIDGARLRFSREDQALVMSFDLALLSGGQGASTVEGILKELSANWMVNLVSYLMTFPRKILLICLQNLDG